MWDGGDLDEVRAVSQSIHTSEDWKRTLITLGDAAMRENRTENAIGYYRMSEFFMYDGDPDKRASFVHLRNAREIARYGTINIPVPNVEHFLSKPQNIDGCTKYMKSKKPKWFDEM